jgi:polysaccharide export outer membrane protein
LLRRSLVVPLLFALAACAVAPEPRKREFKTTEELAQIGSGRLPPPPPLPEPPAPPDLGPLLKADDGAVERIRTGDSLSISVRESPELSVSKARVGRAGTILLPMLGEVHVVGKTRVELADEIRGLLSQREYMRQPEVWVEILFEECRHVLVLGRVNHPGSFSLPVDTRLSILQLMALAGGLATGTTDLEADGSAIRLVRTIGGDKKIFRLSFDQIVEREQLERNVLLEPDDLIFVPPKKEMFIFGSVERPGGFPLADGSRLSVEEALALAGGFRSSAEHEFVTLIRRGPTGVEAYHVSLDPGRRSPTMVTANDTLIATDRQSSRVYIIGQVASSGSHLLDEQGLTVTKLIALAGGFKPNAAGNDVLLIRVTPTGKQNYVVHAQKILDEGRPEDDPELLPGDMVWVPERIF